MHEIDGYCTRLALIWKARPEMNFGPLMLDLFQAYENETHQSPAQSSNKDLFTFFEKHLQSNWKDENNSVNEMHAYNIDHWNIPGVKDFSQNLIDENMQRPVNCLQLTALF